MDPVLLQKEEAACPEIGSYPILPGGTSYPFTGRLQQTDSKINREAPDSQTKNINLKQSSVILERGCKDNTIFTNKTKA